MCITCMHASDIAMRALCFGSVHAPHRILVVLGHLVLAVITPQNHATLLKPLRFSWTPRPTSSQGR